MGTDSSERLRLIRDAVEVLLEGYDVEWLRDNRGQLVGFSVLIPTRPARARARARLGYSQNAPR